MDEPDFPIEYVTAVGRLAIVSSTLEHTAGLILVCVQGAALRDFTGARLNRKDMRKSVQKAATARQVKGEMSRELEVFVTDWVTTTMDLLAERDRVIHAIWGLDLATRGIVGSHRTGAPPSTEGDVMELVLRCRLHVLEWTVERQLSLRRLASDG